MGAGREAHHERNQHEEKEHSGNRTDKYGDWACVCDETHARNRTLLKDREQWGNKTDVEHEGNQRRGRDDERWEAEKLNRTSATTRRTWKNRTAGEGRGRDDERWEAEKFNRTNATKRTTWKNRTVGEGKGWDDERWKAEMLNSTNATMRRSWKNWTGEDERDDDIEWDEDEDEDDERWGKDDRRREVKKCMCGSVPGRWELVGGHGKDNEHWDEDAKEEHDADKDFDIGFVSAICAGGTLGGIIVAVIWVACLRKRVWVSAPPAVGTFVLGRPTTDDVKQTHVAVGCTVEKGQVSTVHETSNADANVIADLERGVGNRCAI